MKLDVFGGMSGFGHAVTFDAPIASVGNFVFFRTILNYLTSEINQFGMGLMQRMMIWVGVIALTLLTLWVLIQGFRIVTGQSKDSMMGLVVNASKATLIVSIATSMAIFGADMHGWLTGSLPDEITRLVTGENESAADQIDENMAWMSVALTAIDTIDVEGDQILDNSKNRAMTFVTLGTGGPALVAGAMLLLYKIAIALFVGLGPLFILCLLFDYTKSLFQRWLFYGIGTMFSMAVLAMMTSIAMEMTTRVAAAFWATSLAGSLLGSEFTDGISSQAMQQGGMGIILTTLILGAPPMAAMFFQGTLGGFVPYSQIGGGPGAARPGPAGQPPGSYYGGYGGGGGGFSPRQPSVDSRTITVQDATASNRYSGAGTQPAVGATGRFGEANNPSSMIGPATGTASDGTGSGARGVADTLPTQAASASSVSPAVEGRTIGTRGAAGNVDKPAG